MREGPVKASLSGDEMVAKVVLAPLAVLGLVVAVRSVAGFVLVAAVTFLALVPASIARSRGRQSLPWYAYGVLLFPVAVGHALMLPTFEERRGPTAGDRQLRALVGGAAALFIALAVGVITNELATSFVQDDTDHCYELASQANTPVAAEERISLLREAAACLDGR